MSTIFQICRKLPSLLHIFVAWVVIDLIIYKKQINLSTLFIQASLTILVYIHSKDDIHSIKFKIQLFLSNVLIFALLYNSSERAWFYGVSYIFIGKYWYIWQTLSHYKKQFQTQLQRYKSDKIFNAFTYAIGFVIISKSVGFILGLFHLHISYKNQVHFALFKAIGQVLPSFLNNGFKGTFLMYFLFTSIFYLLIQLQEIIKNLRIHKSQLKFQQKVVSKAFQTTKSKIEPKEQSKHKKNSKK